MVQHPRGSASFKLLLLQDAFKVLHALLQVPHVSGQVTVKEAHRVAEHRHPRTDAPFIPLRGREKRAERGHNEKWIPYVLHLYTSLDCICVQGQSQDVFLPLNQSTRQPDSLLLLLH